MATFREEKTSMLEKGTHASSAQQHSTVSVQRTWMLSNIIPRRTILNELILHNAFAAGAIFSILFQIGHFSAFLS